MPVFEVIEILSEVDPKSGVTFLAGGLNTQVAEEIVAVATPERLWMKHSKSDKKIEANTHHSDNLLSGLMPPDREASDAGLTPELAGTKQQ